MSNASNARLSDRPGGDTDSGEYAFLLLAMRVLDPLDFDGSHFGLIDSPVSEPGYEVVIRYQEQAIGVFDVK